MKNQERERKFCRESRVVQTHRVFPTDLNTFQTLFGGKLLAIIDITSSISISRHCRRGAVTASTDKMDFLHPIHENHSVCVETYISGVGKKSMEVFAKVTGENLTTGERYLAGTCFMTFVAIPSHMNTETKFTVPLIQPETPEEIMVCSGYEERQKHRQQERTHQKEFIDALSLDIPWTNHARK